MNLPNILTTMRFILTFCFIWVIYIDGLTASIIAAIIFAVASITDYFDGYYARKYNLITNFGKIMDPIADKFLILSAFFIFAHMGIIPWWMVIIIAVREIVITLIRFYAMGKGKVLAAEKMGKYKTVAQIVAVSFILLFSIVEQAAYLYDAPNAILYKMQFLNYVFVFFAVLLTLISGVSFLKNNWGLKSVEPAS